MSKYLIDGTTLVNIADAIRAKTGDESGIDPVNMPEKIDEVYAAGQADGSRYDDGFVDGVKSEYDRFWDNYQNYGKRTDYQQGFAGHGWIAQTFKPKYNVTVSGAANQMFMRSRIEGDLVQIFDDLGLEQLDTSKIYNPNYLFYDSFFTRIGTIDLTSAIYSSYIFQVCPYLKTIDLVILKDDGSTQVNQWFERSPEIEEIRIRGVIGQNGFDMSMCKNLSEESGLSIISALSTTTTGLSVTLPLAWKERYIAEHGLANFEVMTIVARPNWNFLWL